MHDFDEVIDHCQSNSMKWVLGDRWLTPEQRAANPLPMWVAGMDLRVATPIRDALTQEIEYGIFGYGGTPDCYLESVCIWQQPRFGWTVDPAWVTQTPGVVSALNMCIQAFSNAGDHVLIQPPVYFHFQHDVMSNGRRVTTASLTIHGERYVFDPEAFEAAIVPGTRLFILCNPHNPTGNVWSKSDLHSMAEICLRHDILIVAGEVHQDLVFGADARHIPLASVGKDIAERTITCTAPSKTFNTAGLACSNVFISNPRLRQQFRAQCDRAGISLVNTMGTAACDAVYRFGGALGSSNAGLRIGQSRTLSLANPRIRPACKGAAHAFALSGVDGLSQRGHAGPRSP